MTMRSGLGIALVSALLLAGCSDSAKTGGGAEDGSMTGTQTEDTGAVPGNLSLGPPAWQVGQSWTWRLETSGLPEPAEATTVVLAADGASYDVGTTDRGEATLAYPFHLVGFGSVDKATMAWQAHGSPVQLVRFPLKDGDSWTADFWSAPGATVTVRLDNVTGLQGYEPGAKVNVTYAGGDSLYLEAEWSIGLGQFTRVSSHFGNVVPFATATLVRTGTDASGSPFEATDLFRGVANAGAPQGLTPTQVTVPADATYLVTTCFMSFAGQPGLYALRFNQPVASTGCAGGNTPGFSSAYASTGADVTAGPGVVDLAAGGPGSITGEVFAVRTA